MKKKSKLLVLFLVIALAVVTVLGYSRISSSAETVYEDTKNDDRDEIIKKYRKEGIDISIKTEKDLYAEFDKYGVVDKTLREDILAATDDEVLVQFIQTENKQFMEIDENVPDKGVFSECLEETVENNYSDDIINVDTSYYKKGQDSYKKVTTLTNKYGSQCKITITDEEDRVNITKASYIKVGKPKKEGIYKDYGDRKFSYSHAADLCSFSATLGYTLSYGRVDFRYISAEYGNVASGISSIELQDKDCTKAVATSGGEKISAYATFYTQYAQGFYGGLGGCHYKLVLSVEKGGDSNSTWKCGMFVTQHAQAYMKTV